MAHYRAVTLPPAGLARAIHLAALVGDDATVYQRSNDPTDGAEARETWPPDTAGLSPVATPS